jgi:hypothetical protein
MREITVIGDYVDPDVYFEITYNSEGKDVYEDFYSTSESDEDEEKKIKRKSLDRQFLRMEMEEERDRLRSFMH